MTALPHIFVFENYEFVFHVSPSMTQTRYICKKP